MRSEKEMGECRHQMPSIHFLSEGFNNTEDNTHTHLQHKHTHSRAGQQHWQQWELPTPQPSSGSW